MSYKYDFNYYIRSIPNANNLIIIKYSAQIFLQFFNKTMNGDCSIYKSFKANVIQKGQNKKLITCVGSLKKTLIIDKLSGKSNLKLEIVVMKIMM